MKPTIEYRPKKTHVTVTKTGQMTIKKLHEPVLIAPELLRPDDAVTLLERRRAHDRARAKAYRAKKKSLAKP